MKKNSKIPNKDGIHFIFSFVSGSSIPLLLTDLVFIYNFDTLLTLGFFALILILKNIAGK